MYESICQHPLGTIHLLYDDDDDYDNDDDDDDDDNDYALISYK